MRLKNVPGSREAIAESEYTIKNETEMKGKWHELFGNSNPIHIEIGMGKGSFIMEMARRNPNINYIGIEKYSSVLIRAVEKRVQEPEMNNLFFIRMEAEYIEDVFDKGEVGYIYLNFSDPWPKDRHAKRRLTSRQFLARYVNILAEGGGVTFKTDNV
ncbi:MAG TPA: tRNA (guanosine(46)-N7)-methyltransferase TrmB, partial [Lachnospiraceae bacterium]|nr:tRNA (guanosine(46)-N7)-methyltransferase TrmB [Lachnospiraceae bacterium]